MTERTAAGAWLKSATLAAALLLAGPGAFSEGAKAALPPLSENELKTLKLINGSIDEAGDIHIDSITIRRRERELSFPGSVNVREGVVEVLVSTGKGRTHESLIIGDPDPFRLQLALILFGSRNGPAIENDKIPMGDIFDVFVETADGKRRLIDEWLYNSAMDQPKKASGYVFVGSNFSPDNKCLASEEGNTININSMDENTILNARITKDFAKDAFVANTKEIPNYDLKGKENPKPEDYWIPVKVVLKPRAGN